MKPTTYLQHPDDVHRLAGVERVEGDLVINSYGMQRNVNSFEKIMRNVLALKDLREVTGNLRIEHNQYLSDLMGLRGLTRIGGELKIYMNPSLRRLDGLDGIKRIEGGLYIAYNHTLNSLWSLQRVEGIRGLISIYNNRKLGIAGREMRQYPADIISALNANLRMRGMSGMSGLALLRTLKIAPEDTRVFAQPDPQYVVDGPSWDSLQILATSRS